MDKLRNILDMNVGDQFTLVDDDVLQVMYIRTLQTQPKKNVDKNGHPVVPVDYAQMRYGNISFTINVAEDVAIVSDKAQRDDISAITLEVSEFEEEDIDDQGNPVMVNNVPVMKRRRGLAFVSLQTYATKIARDTRRAEAEGSVHATRVKFGLVQDVNAATVDAVAEKLAALLAPKAAPVANAA